MKLKQLKKAADIFKEIEILDAEIVKIEKLFDMVSNKKTSCRLNITIEDLEDKDKVQFDEDGSIINNNSNGTYTFNLLSWGSQKATPTNIHSFENELNDLNTLELLAAIGKIKVATRTNYITQLKEIGINL